MNVGSGCLNEIHLSSARAIIPQFMSIYETVATIDDLNRKIQGHPPRLPTQSPFGIYGNDADELMDQVFESLGKKKPRKPKNPR